jgi:hypothetical protein
MNVGGNANTIIFWGVCHGRFPTSNGKIQTNMKLTNTVQNLSGCKYQDFIYHLFTVFGDTEQNWGNVKK